MTFYSAIPSFQVSLSYNDRDNTLADECLGEFIGTGHEVRNAYIGDQDIRGFECPPQFQLESLID